MRLKFKASAIASVVAVTALSIQGLSPTAAAESGDAGTPTAAAATSPVDPPAESSPPAPVSPEATGLVDVKIEEKTYPIAVPGLTLPLNLGTIDLNRQAAPTAADPQFGGGASGVYTEINVAGAVQVKTSKLGAIGMKPDGALTERSAASILVPGVEVPSPLPMINIASAAVRGVKVRTSGGHLTYPVKRQIATARTEVARLDSSVYFAYIGAEGITSSVMVERFPDGQYKFTGGATFGYLEIAGIPYQTKDSAPNTAYDVVGLGTVVLNEQKITQISGDRYAAEVNAIHITLDTATLGLPAGSDIYIGSAEAILYE